MGEELLSIKEIARRLEVPESNVRYWRDRFEEYLPVKGQGRKRRYSAKALEIFQLIRDGFQENHSTEDIAQELARHYPRTMQVAATPTERETLPEPEEGENHFNSFNTLVQSQAKTLEHLARSLNGTTQCDSRLNDLQRRQDMLHKAVASIWKHHKTHRQQVQEARSTNARTRTEQAELEQRLHNLEQAVAQQAQEQASAVADLHREVREYRYWLQKLVEHLDPDTPKKTRQ